MITACLTPVSSEQIPTNCASRPAVLLFSKNPDLSVTARLTTSSVRSHFNKRLDVPQGVNSLPKLCSKDRRKSVLAGTPRCIPLHSEPSGQTGGEMMPYLAGSLDAPEEAEENDDPAQQQTQRHLPLYGAQFAQTAGDVQHRATATRCVTACYSGCYCLSPLGTERHLSATLRSSVCQMYHWTRPAPSNCDMENLVITFMNCQRVGVSAQALQATLSRLQWVSLCLTTGQSVS